MLYVMNHQADWNSKGEIYCLLLIAAGIAAIVFHKQRTRFIFSVSLFHIAVSSFRNIEIHGDLKQYAMEFEQLRYCGWDSPELWKGGRNTLFYLLNKLTGQLTAGNFRVLLILIAVVSAAALGILLEQYSPQPFISLLIWDCFGYYLFSLYSIKQTLAMAMILLAGKCLLEDNKWGFLFWTVLAGMIHFPAFVFLPAGILTDIQKISSMAAAWISLTGVIWLFREQIVGGMASLYYEGERFAGQTWVMPGGKYLLMAALLAVGGLLCGWSESCFRKLFLLIGTASLLQLFSGYDHIFTRLADYYFQFSVLYIPCLLTQTHREDQPPLIYLDDVGQKLLTALFVVLALLVYQKSYLGVGSDYAASGLLEYRWMWQS